MERWKQQFAESATRRSAEVAHDLKTPLNIAVLNLELARMKLKRFVEPPEEETVSEYLRAVEGELRRMARIFDAYFVYSVPPDTDLPEPLDPLPLVEDVLSSAALRAEYSGGSRVCIHPQRLTVLLHNLVAGAQALLQPETMSIRVTGDQQQWTVNFSGIRQHPDEELSKIFKFYYTGMSGAPELGLATARLIAETYGGSVETHAESEGNLTVQLALPCGDE